ncbi:MAG: PhnD/SsuA/transferrin family substrate-binding protein [Verrucomicrobiota bacterium]
MILKKAFFCYLAAVLFGLAFTSTKAEEVETAFLAPKAVQQQSAPLKLVVGVTDVYCKDSSCKCIEQIATREYGDFCRKLKEKYNIELELSYFAEPYDLDRAFLDGKFDAVLCKPWIVFQHSQGRSGRMVRVADLQDLHGNPGLWGMVLVPKASPIQNLSEISGRRIAIGQPDAYEKHQGALALFKREGIQVAAEKLVQKASCLECLDLLMKGEVDAAVISNYALTADCAVDVTTPDAFRVLGKTEVIPLTSFMVDLKRVSPADAKHLQQALTGLSSTELPKSMSGGGFVAPVSWKVSRPKP